MTVSMETGEHFQCAEFLICVASSGHFPDDTAWLLTLWFQGWVAKAGCHSACSFCSCVPANLRRPVCPVRRGPLRFEGVIQADDFALIGGVAAP